MRIMQCYWSLTRLLCAQRTLPACIARPLTSSTNPQVKGPLVLFILFYFVYSVLASLNLPAAIEDLQGEKVPKSVLDKSTAVTGKGGLQAIDKLMQDLPELLQRNREIMDEVNVLPQCFLN